LSDVNAIGPVGFVTYNSAGDFWVAIAHATTPSFPTLKALTVPATSNGRAWQHRRLLVADRALDLPAGALRERAIG